MLGCGGSFLLQQKAGLHYLVNDEGKYAACSLAFQEVVWSRRFLRHLNDAFKTDVPEEILFGSMAALRVYEGS